MNYVNEMICVEFLQSRQDAIFIPVYIADDFLINKKYPLFYETIIYY